MLLYRTRKLTMIDWKAQKALHLYEDLDKKKPKSEGKEYMITEKRDGWYGYFDSDDGHVRSRANRIIPSMKRVSEGLRQVVGTNQAKRPYRLIFEILHTSITDFHTINGIFNRHDVLPIGDVELLVHDLVFHDSPQMPALERYETLVEGQFDLLTDMIRIAPLLSISSEPKMWQMYAELVWNHDGEGVILKDTKSPFSAGKRNADLLKIKEEVTLDLLVIGITEGKDEFEGMTGALIVRNKAGDINHISGMSRDERIQWYGCQLDIVGKVVETKAMKILPNGSLREGRFKAIRHDKTAADID